MSETPAEFADFMTVADAAASAGIREEAVRNAIYRRRLAAVQVYGRQLIRRADYEAWRSATRIGRPKKDEANPGAR